MNDIVPASSYEPNGDLSCKIAPPMRFQRPDEEIFSRHETGSL